MIIKNFLLATEKGLGNGETPIFPISIFKLKAGVNKLKTDPGYHLFKLACRVSAKRLFPNFSFLDAPHNAQYYKEGRPETEVAYMGCRTRVMGNFYDPENETTYGRGNLSFTSINLPRLAIEAKGNTEKFFKDLFTTMDLVKEQLLDRLEIQSRLHVYNMPFLMGQGVWCGSDKLSYTDEIREVIRHGSLSIGFIGLAEALYALYGKHHGESEEIHNIGKKIIRDMRSRCDEYAIEHKLNFTLLATPAEGLSGRFLNIDKKKYGIIPGVTDKDYYTNSFHIPVGFDISIAKKIELEAPFHAMTNGGHITYVELDGDVASNEGVFEKIILKMDKEGVGYGSINHPIDRDPVCGYTGIIYEECPNCGRKEKEDGIPYERIRRITGYLVGTLDRFNSAKLAEVLDRKKHKGFKSEDIIQ